MWVLSMMMRAMRRGWRGKEGRIGGGREESMTRMHETEQISVVAGMVRERIISSTMRSEREMRVTRL